MAGGLASSVALLMLKYLVPGYPDFLPAVGSEEMASTQNVLLTKDDPLNVKVALNSLAKVVNSLTMLKTMPKLPDNAKIDAAVDEIQCNVSMLSAAPSVDMPGMQTWHISGLHALLNSVSDSKAE
ncbi:hypothetical protein EI94DRAFT_1801846 [Lactarius quietus]|nr:hypothetical protein EI94DRAFT_1801846 [Lactarius quietus]